MENNKNAKFAIGDEVVIVSSNTKGIVKEISALLGEGNNTYIIDVDGVDKMCVEANLTLWRKKNIELKIDINDMAVNFQIEDKIKEIIETIGLVESEDPSVQLSNACKLQAYLTLNDEESEETLRVGNSVTKNELYHGLIDGDYDSIINSYVFSEILKRIGMDVLTVATKAEGNQFYVTNLVFIEDYYYYFDVTLEKAVFQDNGAKPEDFVLCCAGLGKVSYEQFFKPLCLLDFENKLGESVIPSNIALIDIDIDIVNKMLTIGE